MSLKHPHTCVPPWATTKIAEEFATTTENSFSLRHVPPRRPKANSKPEHEWFSGAKMDVRSSAQDHFLDLHSIRRPGQSCKPHTAYEHTTAAFPGGPSNNMEHSTTAKQSYVAFTPRPRQQGEEFAYGTSPTRVGDPPPAGPRMPDHYLSRFASSQHVDWGKDQFDGRSATQDNYLNLFAIRNPSQSCKPDEANAFNPLSVTWTNSKTQHSTTARSSYLDFNAMPYTTHCHHTAALRSQTTSPYTLHTPALHMPTHTLQSSHAIAYAGACYAQIRIHRVPTEDDM